VYIELCKWLDAIMGEGHSWTTDVVKYLCVARPLCFYAYPKEAGELEACLRKCLLEGGTCYSTPGRKPTRQAQTLYDAYRPLIDQLRGRTVVLDSDPLTLPSDVKANIFRTRDGTLFVTAVPTQGRVLDRGKNRTKVPIEVRVPEAARVRRATVQGVLDHTPRPVRLRRSGRSLSLVLPEVRVAALVRLDVASKRR